jgi:hypothetical protein
VTDTDGSDHLRTAYDQLCTSYHAIDDFRAKLLGFLPLVSGGGLILLAGKAEEVRREFFGPVGFLGIAVTLGLLTYELTGIRRCRALIADGHAFEEDMQLPRGQFIRPPDEASSIITKSFAAALIYPAVLAAWTYLALFYSHHTLGKVLSLIVFFAGLVGILLYDQALREESKPRWLFRFLVRADEQASTHGLVRFRWPLAGMVALVVVLACVLIIPQWLVRWELGTPAPTLSAADRVKAINDVRTTLLQGIGGAVLLLGAYFTFRQLAIAQQGQVTERFTRAIEQIGANATKEQVGGIYALERIMVDSARDHGAIVEVLVAFLQEHAGSPEARDKAATWARSSDGSKPPRPPVAVQAALTVLGRRPSRPKAELGPLRLSDTVLMRAFLRGANLQCARMRHARLQRAHMEKAHLDGARLHDAYLERARLREAYLDHTDLEDAHLEGAHLQGARMDSANLVGASMAGAKLDGASLRGAHLAGVKGNPPLTQEQKAEVCCLPEATDCQQASADLPSKHPCARYWLWGRTLDEPAESDLSIVGRSGDQPDQPNKREPGPSTAAAPSPPATPE